MDMTSDHQHAFMGLGSFETYYAIFDQDNYRVGFAESINSQLTPAQSLEFNSSRLQKMSLIELFDYHGEKLEYEMFRGQTIGIGLCASLSLLLTTIIATYCVKEPKKDSLIANDYAALQGHNTT